MGNGSIQLMHYFSDFALIFTIPIFLTFLTFTCKNKLGKYAVVELTLKCYIFSCGFGDAHLL